jgi:hypothetical protein
MCQLEDFIHDVGQLVQLIRGWVSYSFAILRAD